MQCNDKFIKNQSAITVDVCQIPETQYTPSMPVTLKKKCPYAMTIGKELIPFLRLFDYGYIQSETTQTSILHSMVKYASAFWLSNTKL